MVRILGNIVGAVFAGVLLIALGSTVSGYISEPPVPSAQEEFHLHPEHLALSSDGPFGKYDKAQLQRGLQVYKEVCASCHALSRVSFRDLKGLGYNDAQVKNFAASYQIADINPDNGEPAMRKGIPSDYFPSPFPNDTAARANNNNALPPDLSLITKSREGGASYVHALLTGYRDPKTYKNKHGQSVPKEAMPATATLHFNPYFANLNLAMPQPLTSDGQVTYAEGNPKPTVEQMSTDVAAFLVWTAEPKLENRHRYGTAVLIFLLIATVLGYFSYQNIWAEAKRKVAPIGPLDPENKAKRTRAKAKAGIKG